MNATNRKEFRSCEPLRRDVLVRELGAELNALISAARAVTMQAAENLDPSLSGSAVQVLLWLHSFGPAKASRIAEALAMDRSVISRLTKQLSQFELVEAREDAQDGRGVVYVLTKVGRQKAADAVAQKGNLFQARIADWDAADLEQLTLLLRRLNGRV